MKTLYLRIYHHPPLWLSKEILTNFPVSAAVNKDKAGEKKLWVREW
jgi:hypothetical protein